MVAGIISTIVFILYLWTYTDSVSFIDKYMELTVQIKMGITIAFVVFMILTMVVFGLWISKKQDEEMLRILKLQERKGDDALMVILELV